MNATPYDPAIVAAVLCKYVRGQADITQADLARRVGVERSTVARWERYARGIDPKNLRKLLQVLIEHIDENG